MVENGTEILKVFLNVSREEQRQRFLERIERPDKNWKFSAGDVKERGYWDDYTRAYEDCFSHTSTPWAPWYIVPADHKWFTRLVVGAIVVEKLMEMDPQYPTFDEAHRQELEECRELLEKEPGPP
jgi:polyphosphate kinase 2 (PPK2 family)